jgi:Fe-S-cluster containining protein
VETTVAEMLPLALQLFAEGQVENVWERLQNGSVTCAQYEALPGQAEKGRCRNYAQRPVLCRLFGYVGVRDKTGQTRYAACRVLQKVEAERIQMIEAELKKGQLDLPFFAPAQERIAEIGGSLGAEIMPINQALIRALEMIGLSQHLEGHEGLEPLCN